MKNKLTSSHFGFKMALLCLLTLLIAYACKKTEVVATKTELLADAKNWFLKEKNIFYVPSWDDAIIFKNKNINYLIT